MFGGYVYDYVKWHYGRAFRSLWRIVNNFIYFFYNLFSIPLLLRTLFSPWKKMTEQKQRGLHAPQEIFERIAGNIFVRIIGFIIRIVTVTVGLVFCLGIFVCGLLFTIVWIFIPLITPLSFIVGVRLIV